MTLLHSHQSKAQVSLICVEIHTKSFSFDQKDFYVALVKTFVIAAHWHPLTCLSPVTDQRLAEGLEEHSHSNSSHQPQTRAGHISTSSQEENTSTQLNKA